MSGRGGARVDLASALYDVDVAHLTEVRVPETHRTTCWKFGYPEWFSFPKLFMSNGILACCEVMAYDGDHYGHALSGTSAAAVGAFRPGGVHCMRPSTSNVIHRGANSAVLKCLLKHMSDI